MTPHGTVKDGLWKNVKRTQYGWKSIVPWPVKLAVSKTDVTPSSFSTRLTIGAHTPVLPVNPSIHVIMRICFISPIGCYDKNIWCHYWQRLGQCEKNPGYMKLYCRKACKICTWMKSYGYHSTSPSIPSLTGKTYSPIVNQVYMRSNNAGLHLVISSELVICTANSKQVVLPNSKP